MVKSIVLVTAILVALLYAALFLMWNAETKAHIVTWKLGGDPYWLEGLPVGVLPVFGALLGAVAMAIAAWVPWANQRAAAKKAETKYKLAVAKYNEQKEVLAARMREIEELQSQLNALQGGATAVASAPPAEEPLGGESASAEATEDAPQATT